ncbi:MAG: amidophosphoribosyltransferase [Candidatus Aminicenantes bacterium]|nr:amidophosphoribosyltransferase [Candidatus Aminicenantes bacterium]
MGGFFGAIGKQDVIADLYYGIDYHSHLGTKRGGVAVVRPDGFARAIHNIENAQFRTKFDPEIPRLRADRGIGVISDTDDQPLLIKSHLGEYALVTVGVIKNADALVATALRSRRLHFAEMSQGGINPTELAAALIDQGDTFEEGIAALQDAVEGSCSLLLLTKDGFYAARDRYGRTPVIIGRKDGVWAATQETCAFPNLGFEYVRDLGPGEIVFVTSDGAETRREAGPVNQICAFLWVYYGYPASTYEGINVEWARNRCGAALARRHPAEVDFVAGIPDSGVGHGIGFAAEAKLPFRRPFVKYTPTWARSFMPQNQDVRDLVARMKLVPIRELIQGKSFLFCEDSIVRGTQLKDVIQRLYDFGAREIHMRPACPPLVYGCKFLNFSVSRSEMDLAARRAIREIEGETPAAFEPYADPSTSAYAAMEERIRQRLNLTTLKYQHLDDLVEAIGKPKHTMCTYCWDGVELKSPPLPFPRD